MQEIWEDVKGYEGCYQVSNHGRVRSVDRIVKSKHINGVRTFKKMNGKMLKSATDERSYPIVGLSINNKLKTHFVHRLMAIAFIPNPENKRTINHKDGDKQNNLLSNIEWATYSENHQHAFRTGIRKPIYQYRCVLNGECKCSYQRRYHCYNYVKINQK